jgi:hypothetical protein
MIMTQGNWQADASVIGASVIALVILKGGDMSKQTRTLVAIGVTGAVVALLVDGYIKPKMLP